MIAMIGLIDLEIHTERLGHATKCFKETDAENNF